MRALRVGLTGSIGAGKTEALKAFAAAGAQTVSADAIAHELARPGRPLARVLERLFGDTGRRAVAELVFRDASARRRLERASHPLILRELDRRLSRPRRPVQVADLPLLFEAGLGSRFDLTVCVTAPSARRLARVARRDRSSRADAARRDRAQWPEARKASLSDVVIRNDGPRTALRRRVAEYQRAFALIAASLGGRP